MHLRCAQLFHFFITQMEKACKLLSETQAEYVRDAEKGFISHKSKKSCGPTYILKTSRPHCRPDAKGCPQHAEDGRPCVFYERYTDADVKLLRVIEIKNLPQPNSISHTHDSFTFGFETFAGMPLCVLGKEIMIGCVNMRSVADESKLVCGGIDLVMWDYEEKCTVPVEVKTTDCSYHNQARVEHVLQLRLYMELLLRQSQNVTYGLLVVIDKKDKCIKVFRVPMKSESLYKVQHGRKHALIKVLPSIVNEEEKLLK